MKALRKRICARACQNQSRGVVADGDVETAGVPLRILDRCVERIRAILLPRDVKSYGKGTVCILGHREIRIRTSFSAVAVTVGEKASSAAREVRGVF